MPENKLDLFIYSTKADTGVNKLVEEGFQPAELQLLDKSKYMEDSQIREQYSNEDGLFDEDAFKKDYDKAVASLNEYSAQLSEKEIYTTPDFNPETGGMVKPSGRGLGDLPMPKAVFTPDGDYSKSHINERAASDVSMREWAQQNKVWDNVNNKWEDFSGQDDSISGFVDFFFKPKDTLVYATWDEDGVHEDSRGNQVQHKRGQYRLDENGQPFMEYLNGRDPGLKETVSVWDTITDEGTFMNRLNFMENDDTEKNPIGAVMRTAAVASPYILAAVAGRGKWKIKPTMDAIATAYTIAGIGSNLANSGMEAYKQGLGIAYNDEAKEREDYKKLNTIQGILRGSHLSTTDASRGSFNTLDNYLKMAGESVLQLKQQVGVAKGGAAFGKSVGFS